MNVPYSLAIHGGAGTILRSQMTAEKELEYVNALTDALQVGEKILAAGGRAVEAVEASVRTLEDCPLFNAGRGSVYNHDERHEMDAAIMDGRTLDAGAVALICGPRNPITLARTVMERSEHVFLCGSGAEDFARMHKLRFEPAEYFADVNRLDQLQQARKEDAVRLDHSDERKFGTVGAVARDRNGDLAAATSTGGVTNKRFGRVGDSPLIGAGTYAKNNTCAVSCTGYGEDFIRGVVAFDLSCLMEYKGLSLDAAADYLLRYKLPLTGAVGGLIAVAADGTIALPFNSEGMYRGSVREGEVQQIAIFGR